MGTFILVRYRPRGCSDILGGIESSLGIFFGSHLRVSSVLRVGYLLSSSQVFYLRITVIASGGALVSAANVYLQFYRLERYRQCPPHSWCSQVRGTLEIFRYSSGRVSDSCIFGSGVKWCLSWASSALLLELHTSTSRIFIYNFELVDIFRQKRFWVEVIF